MVGWALFEIGRRRQHQPARQPGRVHGVFDLGSGGFSGLELTDGKGAEAITRGASITGEVRIGDRNYCRASVLHRFRQDNAMQADFIVRTGWNSFKFTTPDGNGDYP
jgi:hypothetical protein